MHVFYISSFVLCRDEPLCFRYICKLIALYPCRLFHCMYSFVCADWKQLKIDAEQVLGMRLHNYMVCSQCTRVPPHNSHALFLAYLFPWSTLSLYHAVFDYATCFRMGQMKPSRQRLQHKTWPTSHLSTHLFGDTACSPCGIAHTDRRDPAAP